MEGVSSRNNGNNGTAGGASGGPRSWSPPPPSVGENLKKESGGPGPRPTSPRPSGRIAMPADSPIPQGQMPPPIFNSQTGYPRPPFPNIFNRWEPSSVKPTSSSTSALSFPPGTSKTTELPSPGARDTSQYSKFDPLSRPNERERDELYDSSTPNSKQDFDSAKSPALEISERDRSPASSLRRPSSSDTFDRHSPTNRANHVPSDSTTDKITSPLLQGSKPLDHHFKTERSGSPLSEDRRRSFSGDFQRESHSRHSTQSTPTSRSEVLAAQDLRTNDQEERIKRETNLEKFETLRRLQVATASFPRPESAIGTIQKLEMFQQSREAFLSPGGFNVPLTAPLGIPASDLARIAISVPDPAGNGELTSGSGESHIQYEAQPLKRCRFQEQNWNVLSAREPMVTKQTFELTSDNDTKESGCPARSATAHSPGTTRCEGTSRGSTGTRSTPRWSPPSLGRRRFCRTKCSTTWTPLLRPRRNPDRWICGVTSLGSSVVDYVLNLLDDKLGGFGEAISIHLPCRGDQPLCSVSAGRVTEIHVVLISVAWF